MSGVSSNACDLILLVVLFWKSKVVYLFHLNESDENVSSRTTHVFSFRYSSYGESNLRIIDGDM